MDTTGARVLIRTAYICSSCEMALRLKIADEFPKKCPYCGAEFSFSNTSGSMDTAKESIVSLKNGAIV